MIHNLQIRPPDNVLNSLCYQYMDIESKFIFLAVLLKASMSTIPGQIRVRKYQDWQGWNISYETILNCLNAMETHNIISLQEQKSTLLVTLSNFDNYGITDNPVFP